MSNKKVQIEVATRDTSTKTFQQIKQSAVTLCGELTKLRDAYLLLEGAPAALQYVTQFTGAAKNWALAVDEVADATGAAAEEASKMLVIGKYTGVATEEAAGYFAKFGKQVSESIDEMKQNGDKANDVFSRMGFTLQDLQGKNSYEIYQKTTAYLREMESGAEKTRVQMDLFGKSGYKINDMLNLTSEEIQQLTEKARKQGLIINDQTSAAWEKFDRRLNDATGIAHKLSTAIGNDLLPVLDQKLTTVETLIDKYLDLNDGTRKNAAAIAANGVELVLWLTAGKGAIKVLEMMSIRVGALAGPWGVLATAIAFATAKLYDHIDASNRVPGYGGGGEVRADQVRDGKGGWKTEYSVKAPDTLGGWRKMTDDELAAMREYQTTPQGIKGDTNTVKYDFSVKSPSNTLRDRAKQGGKDPAQEAQELQNKIDNMYRSLNEKIAQETGTTLSYELMKVADEVEKMQGELAAKAGKFAEYGLDTSALSEMMKQYGDTMTKKYTDEQTRSLKSLQSETASINAGLVSDYEAAAEAKYQAALVSIEKEKEERWKATGDMAAAEAWAVAKKKAAEKEKSDAVRDGLLQDYDLNVEHNSMLLLLAGQNQSEIDALNKKELEAKIRYLDKEIDKAKENKDERIRLEREKAEAIRQINDINAKDLSKAYSLALQEILNQQFDYRDLMISTWGDINFATKDHFKDMVTGAESMSAGIKGVILDIKDSILDMMLEISYQQLIMKPVKNWFSSLLGGLSGVNVSDSGNSSFSGGSTRAQTTGSDYWTYIAGSRASGGPVSAGMMYQVNDGPGRRIETFVPSVNGYILSGNQTQQAVNSAQQPIYVAMNVYANDAPSFRRSQGQILSELNAALSAARRNA